MQMPFSPHVPVFGNRRADENEGPRFASRQREVQLRQCSAEPDVRQHERCFVGQYGPEAQHLLVPCRRDPRVDLDHASELVRADRETAVVAAVAAVFEQQPVEGCEGFLHGRSRRTGAVLLHFPAQIVVCHLRVGCFVSAKIRQVARIVNFRPGVSVGLLVRPDSGASKARCGRGRGRFP